MSGGTTSDFTGGKGSDEFFNEARLARSLGAARYRSGSREVDWRQPPPPAPAREGIVEELDYAQTEQAVDAWLTRRGLDRDVLEAIIHREEEAMSA